MKILQINIFGNLSTGRIAVDLYRALKSEGHDGIVAYARNSIAEDVPSIRIGNKLSVYYDGIMSRLTDRAGFYSYRATKKLIEQIKQYDPDIIHLHNIHGYYLNIELLFDFLRSINIPVVWTLHDCWAFTGHCCYYSMAGCDKWKNGCSNCPQIKAYPKSLFFDNSKWNYEKKKALFTSVPNLHLVCVSNWLDREVEQSFLRGVPHEVIHNGILNAEDDTDVANPLVSLTKNFSDEANVWYDCHVYRSAIYEDGGVDVSGACYHALITGGATVYLNCVTYSVPKEGDRFSSWDYEKGVIEVYLIRDGIQPICSTFYVADELKKAVRDHLLHHSCISFILSLLHPLTSATCRSIHCSPHSWRK